MPPCSTTPRPKNRWHRPAPTDSTWKGALRYAREVGGPALRKLTFTERGVMLKKLADAICAP